MVAKGKRKEEERRGNTRRSIPPQEKCIISSLRLGKAKWAYEILTINPIFQTGCKIVEPFHAAENHHVDTALVEDISCQLMSHQKQCFLIVSFHVAVRNKCLHVGQYFLCDW